MSVHDLWEQFGNLEQVRDAVTLARTAARRTYAGIAQKIPNITASAGIRVRNAQLKMMAPVRQTTAAVVRPVSKIIFAARQRTNNAVANRDRKALPYVKANTRPLAFNEAANGKLTKQPDLFKGPSQKQEQTKQMLKQWTEPPKPPRTLTRQK